jgi:2-polyprenyl-3-methyl-5-hydroxy-6-metoxy-1,4-benzoquinol methylase
MRFGKQERSMIVEHINRDYYDQHYRAAHPLLFLAHGLLSFDQQSKTRRNLAMLEPALRDARNRAPNRRLRVLDYGAGFGTLLLSLPSQSLEAHAYDLSAHAIAQLEAGARWLGRDIVPVRLDAAGKLAISGLDLILCSHVLEHVASDHALLTDFVSALGSGGLLFINVPINEVWDDPKHARRYRADDFPALLERHGLEVISTQQADRWTGWLLAHEMGSEPNRLKRSWLRCLRMVLAQLPVRWLDQRWLAELPPQQLLVLARKP